MPFRDGFFPGTVIDEITTEENGEKIQKWKCQFDDGEVWSYDFDKLMQGITYQKIYPFGMIYENDKFTDEKKIKHPITQEKTCDVDKDSKPESANQALSKPPFQPLSNKYEDNVDPTKDLRCSKQIKKKKKDDNKGTLKVAQGGTANTAGSTLNLGV